MDRLNIDCRHRARFTYRQGYHFVLVSKICVYFQGQCLTKRECAYQTSLFLNFVLNVS